MPAEIEGGWIYASRNRQGYLDQQNKAGQGQLSQQNKEAGVFNFAE